MGLQTIISDAKTRLDAWSSRGTKSARTSIDGLREVNGIVLGGVQTLVKTEAEGTRDLLDSLDRVASRASTVIVEAYVRRVEGSGRVAVPEPIANWIETVAKRQRVIVVAFGNPYMIGQFPSVGSYLMAYGVNDDLERASVNALFGRARITGTAPISLPGVFKAGDGLRR